MAGRKQAGNNPILTGNSYTTETRTSSDCSGQYSFLIYFQIGSFTKVVLIICLVTVRVIPYKSAEKNMTIFLKDFLPKKSKVFDILVIKTFLKLNFGYF